MLSNVGVQKIKWLQLKTLQKALRNTKEKIVLHSILFLMLLALGFLLKSIPYMEYPMASQKPKLNSEIPNKDPVSSHYKFKRQPIFTMQCEETKWEEFQRVA